MLCRSNVYNSDKALFFEMAQCPVVVKMQFQHSVITMCIFRGFSLKVLYCSSFWENFINQDFFAVFFFGKQ